MSEYSATLIEHFSNPRNVGEMAGATATAVVKSPVCGDQVHLFVKLSDDRISECSYVAYGCAGSLAMGSVLTETIRGRRVDELRRFTEEDFVSLLGGLTPAQRHCASMACEALAELAKSCERPAALGAAQRGSP